MKGDDNNHSDGRFGDRHSFQQPQNVPTPQQQGGRPNDIEIIVHGQQSRAYAEIIETRFKKLGLLVDLIFPNPTAQMSAVLGDLSNRGVCYAAVVYEENEARQSVTINILQGNPQEHRNMPLEDAFNLVQTHFMQKKGGSAPGPGGMDVLTRGLLSQIIDGRILTLQQYDKCADFIRSEREKVDRDMGNRGRRGMGEFEENRERSRSTDRSYRGGSYGEYPGKPADNKQFKQEDVQKRIMNILSSNGGGAPAPVPVAPVGQPSMGGMGPSPGVPQPFQPHPSSINFNNPSVQKALENLGGPGKPNQPGPNYGQQCFPAFGGGQGGPAFGGNPGGPPGPAFGGAPFGGNPAGGPGFGGNAGGGGYQTQNQMWK